MTNETFGRICFAVALLLIGSRTLGDYVIFPYIAVTKAEKGEFKEACAYVVGREKTKASHKNIIMINGKYYDDIDIFAISATLPTNKQIVWDNFPIKKNVVIYQK